MMSTIVQQPATTPIPVQLSEPEFEEFIFPHLSMPKRGPKCKLGYHRVFNLILWVLYTGMPWKCLPVPKDPPGKPAIHYTTVYKVFAKWADDGSLWQAFIASVRHLADQKHLDLSVLHGDGTNTVAKKGGMGSGIRGTNTRRARRSSRSQTTMGMSELPSPWLPSMRRIWCSFLRV
jgi:transposase